MTKTEAIQKLHEAFAAVENAVGKFAEKDFFQKPTNGKWPVAAHVEHLFLSVKPLVSLFGQKEFMLEKWGKSSHSSLTYDELASSYLQGLATVPGVAVPAFTPAGLLSHNELLNNLHSIHEKFVERATALTEEELETCQVPHPLLGLLTCREFIDFTRYHSLHHLKAILDLVQSER